MLKDYLQRIHRVMRWRLSKNPSARDQLIYEVTRLILAAFEGERPVAWCTVYTMPMEIVTAMGFIPFNHEIGGAMLAHAKLGIEALELAEERGFSRDSCSYHRAALGAGLNGHFPRPTVMIGTAHLCDSVPKTYEIMCRYYGVDFTLLDTPMEINEAALDYAEEQLWRTIEALSQAKGEPLDQDRLVEVIRLSNQIRERMLRVNELRQHVPSPWHGRQAFDFIFLAYLLWGTETLLQIYDKRVAELETETATPSGDGQEKYRLLWLGPMPQYETEIFSLLEEELGAHPVFEETSVVYWDEIDERQPVRSLARKMMQNFGLGRIENRARTAVRLARDYRVDGAIHFSHWGCRQACGGVRIIKDALAEINVPLLNLDGDGMDERNYAAGQVKTRLEGFIEMLG
ncbi:MAG: 2-hydroxyacyl-CoA dehydratase subunit D [Anaerolineae bacterium]